MCSSEVEVMTVAIVAVTIGTVVMIENSCSDGHVF